VSGSAPRHPKRSCPQMFLESARPERRFVEFQPKQTVFTQGEAAQSIIYIQKGQVKLSVCSATGRQAVLAVLGPEDFVGEECLTGHPVRIVTATAITPSILLVIEKDEMNRSLHLQRELSSRFISYVIRRNIRAEEDLVDQIFNSIEKRLARALLLLARYGSDNQPEPIFPQVTQETLAQMIGTTRARVNVFMNRFKKRGFISYNGGLRVKSSLLSVILRD
jgi:CRP/FNR family transcriptional regulator, cyclic AMP receptor protein